MSNVQLRHALAWGALTCLVACGPESLEQQLREAKEAVEALEAELADARKLLQERAEELDVARKAHDEAAQQVREVESRLAAAKAEVGAQATDDVLFRSVQSRLLEDTKLEQVAISASVTGGVVTLRGAVADPRLRDRAVEVAREVPGVRQVMSEIRVSGTKPRAKPEAKPES